MLDPSTPHRETSQGGADSTDALIGLLELSEQWIRAHMAEAHAEAEHLTARLADLAATLAARDAEVARMHAERDRLGVELAEREQAQAGLRAELEQRKQAQARLQAELDRRGQAQARLEDALAAERRAVADKGAEIGRLQNSTSWRVTRPLRRALLTIRGIVGRHAPDPPG